jgi:hypothetical protein
MAAPAIAAVVVEAIKVVAQIVEKILKVCAMVSKQPSGKKASPPAGPGGRDPHR